MALSPLKLPKLCGSRAYILPKARQVSKWIPSSIRTLLNIDSLQARQIGDPILREEAETVDITTIHSPEFKQMIERMFRVMRKAEGFGIAAPQIGVGLRVIVVEFTGKHIKMLKDKGATDKELKRLGIALVPPKVFINPEYKTIDQTLLAFREGCLSVEGYSAVVPRAKEIECKAVYLLLIKVMVLSPTKLSLVGSFYVQHLIKARQVSKWVPNSIRKFLTLDSLQARQIGDPTLRQQAENVDITTIRSPEFKQMIERMFKVMRKANVSSISAPQIGVRLRVIALEKTAKQIKELKEAEVTDRDIKTFGRFLLQF
ncbi:unnamed protein product [Pocillopora meandrina]|uniref:Peptide deformylase n=1 Tax=Pocillopora meandrina TaxID=46732 RepID=A0AAU9W370_9CNID|nr:unnamed protein product [Pocillopora meandrina]